MESQTDGRADGRKDGQVEGQTDGQNWRKLYTLSAYEFGLLRMPWV